MQALIDSLASIPETASVFNGDGQPRIEHQAIRLTGPGMGDLLVAFERKIIKGDTVSFYYAAYDSNDGEVLISYTCNSGDDLSSDGESGHSDCHYDVSITAHSDVWGVLENAAHILAAVKLHQQLGHDAPYGRM